MAKERKRRIRPFRILFLLACLAAAILIPVNFYLDARLNSMERSDPIQADEAGVSSEAASQIKKYPVTNIAVFGMDHDGDSSDSSMDRSDAIKILSINTLTNSIKVTSVQRDTLVWIPDPVNDFSKWNHAYWWGGPQLALKTLNMNLDLDITEYISVSFEAVEALVESIGGIDVSLSQEEVWAIIYDRGVALEDRGAGVYHLNGKQALAYARIRSIDDDYARMERQNNVIKAVASSLKSLGIGDIENAAKNVLPYIETNITNGEIKRMAVTALLSNVDKTKSYQLPENGMDDVATILSYGGYSPLYKLKSYSDMIRNLHAFIYGDRNYQVSSQALEIEQKIYSTFYW